MARPSGTSRSKSTLPTARVPADAHRAGPRRPTLTSPAMADRSGGLPRRADEHGFLAVVLGEQSLQVFDLWQVVDDDVGIAWIESQKVLVIVLGRIELAVGLNLRDDGRAEDACLAELRDVGLCHVRLLGIFG